MINLLPPQEKLKLKKEKSLNIILNIGFLVFCLLLSLALILSSIFFYLRGKLVLEEEILETTRTELRGAREKNLEEEIEFYMAAAEEINKFEKGQTSLVDLFGKIREALPRGSRLSNFSYDGESISLSGYCPRRSDLLSFKEELEKEFAKVYFPSSNWVKAEDINFSVRITF